VINLKAARAALGLTQQDLAAALGCSQPLVALVERGKRGFSPARSRQLEQMLGMVPEPPSRPEDPGISPARPAPIGEALDA
jgi:transcriptional regulator with XRE-family HTH domain